MNIQMKIAVAISLMACTTAFAAGAPSSYEEAKAAWLKERERADYQDYLTGFAQFNNHFQLDSKDGCYALDPGPVELMLVISHPDNDEYAVIERVLSNVDNAKSRCFEKTYRGIRTKIPPFLPFVLQMHMG